VSAGRAYQAEPVPKEHHMKRGICVCVAFGLFFSLGCKTSTTTAPSANPNEPEKVRELTVKSPGDQSVRHNGSDKLSISISRKNFDSPVAIELRNLPPGVQVVTKDLTIPPGKTSVDVTLQANPDAKEIKEHKVDVVAIPKDEKGMGEVVTDFKLEVKKKD
jgi:hypothetical protein